MNHLVITPRAWDSHHYQLKIGTYEFSPASEGSIEDLIQQAKSESYDLLYIFSDSVQVHQDIALKYPKLVHYHGSKVTLNTTLEMRPSLELHPETSGASPLFAQISERLQVQQLALQSAESSRFFLDKQFDQSASAQMYDIWIDKCFAEQDPHIPIILKEGEQLSGICSLALSPMESQASIELFAIDSQFRGQGLGAKLIQSALDYLSSQQISKCSVATQGTNIPALSLYTKFGFTPASEQFISHIWL